MNSRIVACYAPNESYSRHSEGAFLRLKDGRILFAYSRFTGSWNDDAPSDIVGVFSCDEGKSWSKAQTLIRAGIYGAQNVMSVSLMRMQSGELGLFYIVKQTKTMNRIILSLSQDEGESFYRHIDCVSDFPGYYVLNNDRATRLASGRILLPMAFHRSGILQGKTAIDGKGFAVCLYSDDDGETWLEAPDIVFPPFTGTETGLQEPGVTEMKDGSLYAYFRTDRGVQYEARSFDGGLHWTAAQPSRFTGPASPLKIGRAPSGRLYAAWNPIPNYNGRSTSAAGWGRIPLALAYSDDEGRSWSDYQIVEAEEGHGYCYPAMFFPEEGCMLLAYCSGGEEDKACLARLSINRILL